MKKIISLWDTNQHIGDMDYLDEHIPQIGDRIIYNGNSYHIIRHDMSVLRTENNKLVADMLTIVATKINYYEFETC